LFGNDDDNDSEAECLSPSPKSSLCAAVSMSADSLSPHHNHQHAVLHPPATATTPAVNKGHPMSLTLRCANKSETISVQIFSENMKQHLHDDYVAKQPLRPIIT
jgi:hypothetical protein